ncbi:MAG: sel1 repeat family protein [Lentisphaeria bacterium]|nr:sel1 repeat family protein [Lentisphaeria bacterium]
MDEDDVFCGDCGADLKKAAVEAAEKAAAEKAAKEKAAKEAAEKAARKAAEQGDAEAQYSLGRRYYNGEGVVKDYAEAVKWYRKAAEEGHSGAQNSLRVCYVRGEGVVKDYAEAVKWCRKAAEQGNETAQKNIDEYIERWKEEKEAFKIMCFVDGVIFLLWLLGFIYVWKWQGVTGISYMPTPGSSKNGIV